MPMDELKSKFLNVQANQKLQPLKNMIQKSLNTQGAWTNREEEWYVVNKLLLFAT
jgi:hypothetical protein